MIVIFSLQRNPEDYNVDGDSTSSWDYPGSRYGRDWNANRYKRDEFSRRRSDTDALEGKRPPSLEVKRRSLDANFLNRRRQLDWRQSQSDQLINASIEECAEETVFESSEDSSSQITKSLEDTYRPQKLEGAPSYSSHSEQKSLDSAAELRFAQRRGSLSREKAIEFDDEHLSSERTPAVNDIQEDYVIHESIYENVVIPKLESVAEECAEKDSGCPSPTDLDNSSSSGSNHKVHKSSTAKDHSESDPVSSDVHSDTPKSRPNLPKVPPRKYSPRKKSEPCSPISPTPSASPPQSLRPHSYSEPVLVRGDSSPSISSPSPPPSTASSSASTPVSSPSKPVRRFPKRTTKRRAPPPPVNRDLLDPNRRASAPVITPLRTPESRQPRPRPQSAYLPSEFGSPPVPPPRTKRKSKAKLSDLHRENNLTEAQRLSLNRKRYSLGDLDLLEYTEEVTVQGRDLDDVSLVPVGSAMDADNRRLELEQMRAQFFGRSAPAVSPTSVEVAPPQSSHTSIAVLQDDDDDLDDSAPPSLPVSPPPGSFNDNFIAPHKSRVVVKLSDDSPTSPSVSPMNPLYEPVESPNHAKDGSNVRSKVVLNFNDDVDDSTTYENVMFINSRPLGELPSVADSGNYTDSEVSSSLLAASSDQDSLERPKSKVILDLDSHQYVPQMLDRQDTPESLLAEDPLDDPLMTSLIEAETKGPLVEVSRPTTLKLGSDLDVSSYDSYSNYGESEVSVLESLGVPRSELDGHSDDSDLSDAEGTFQATFEPHLTQDIEEQEDSGPDSGITLVSYLPNEHSHSPVNVDYSRPPRRISTPPPPMGYSDDPLAIKLSPAPSPMPVHHSPAPKVTTPTPPLEHPKHVDTPAPWHARPRSRSPPNPHPHSPPHPRPRSPPHPRPREESPPAEVRRAKSSPDVSTPERQSRSMTTEPRVTLTRSYSPEIKPIARDGLIHLSQLPLGAPQPAQYQQGPTAGPPGRGPRASDKTAEFSTTPFSTTAPSSGGHRSPATPDVVTDNKPAMDPLTGLRKTGLITPVDKGHQFASHTEPSFRVRRKDELSSRQAELENERQSLLDEMRVRRKKVEAWMPSPETEIAPVLETASEKKYRERKMKNDKNTKKDKPPDVIPTKYVSGDPRKFDYIFYSSSSPCLLSVCFSFS